MAWQTPKTDWDGAKVNGVYFGDRFHVSDYNRIAGNLRYLHVAGQNVYDKTVDTIDPSEQDESGAFSASIMNAITQCLFDLCGNTFLPSVYTGKITYAGNGKLPDKVALNMIESSCAALYENYDTFPKELFAVLDDGFTASDGVLTIRG